MILLQQLVHADSGMLVSQILQECKACLIFLNYFFAVSKEFIGHNYGHVYGHGV